MPKVSSSDDEDKDVIGEQVGEDMADTGEEGGDEGSGKLSVSKAEVSMARMTEDIAVRTV